MTNTYSSPQQVHNMFNSGNSGNSGYGSTTDESENGSPLRGPRYLPVYDTPLLGATIDNDDLSEDDASDDSDHEHSNGDAVNNIPIHFKAMALSKKVAWNLPPENMSAMISENDALSSSRTGKYPSRSRRRNHRWMSILVACVVVVGLVAITNLQKHLHNLDKQHFRPTKELTSDLPYPAISRDSINAKGSPNRMFDMDLFVPDMKKTLLPFPTGAFWTNFVLKRDPSQNSNNNQDWAGQLSDPVIVYPYAFKWNQGIIAISYPSFRRIVQPYVIQDVFWPDISFSVSEGVVSRKILSYDHLSVTLRMNAPRIATENEAVSFFDMYMVQGSPYITGKFTRSSPKLDALSVWDKVGCVSDYAHVGGLCTISKADDQNNFYVSMTGVQFLITQAEGQQWILFVNDGVPITFLITADRHTIVTAHPYTGVIRLAIVPPGADLNGKTVNNLLNHSSIYPIASKVLIDYEDVPKVTKLIISIFLFLCHLFFIFFS